MAGGDGGSIRVNLMFDPVFRADCLDMVRAQVKPALVDLVATTVAPDVLKSSMTTYFKNQGTKSLVDLCSDEVYRSLIADRTFIESVVQAAERRFDQQLDAKIEKKMNDKVHSAVAQALARAKLSVGY